MSEVKLESGWQIGIVRAHGSDLDAWPTMEEAKSVMEANGLKLEEWIEAGIAIAAIPEEWARQAQVELHGEVNEEAEVGMVIQECNVHRVTGPDGEEWDIEVPLP